jgi:dTDP-4-dehydrorhamnose 3,5-epimerase
MNLPRIIRSPRHLDHRGSFSEIFHAARLRELGISCAFVQDNLSTSARAGTLRGLHFQVPPAAQAKLITVVQGRIFDVAVDVRRGSPSFGRHVSVELSAEDDRQLFVPVGFAHGFLTLEHDVAVVYKVSRHYSPAHERGVRWSDPTIAIAWPFESEDVITSAKDAQLPLLAQLDSPFPYAGDPLSRRSLSEPGEPEGTRP